MRGDQPVSVFGDLDGARRGRLFHPGCQIRFVAQGRVFIMQFCANSACDHQPCIDAYPYVKIQTPITLQHCPEGLNILKERQAGLDSALRVIVMGDRRAKEGQDSIPHQAGNRAAVTIDIQEPRP